MDSLLKETAEVAATLQRLEVERCDALMSAIWQQALRGNLPMIDRVIKLMERRCRLLGLDAPQKIASTTPSGEQPAPPAAPYVTDTYCAEIAQQLACYGRSLRAENGQTPPPA
jgi:hypothetical protein